MDDTDEFDPWQAEEVTAGPSTSPVKRTSMSVDQTSITVDRKRVKLSREFESRLNRHKSSRS